MNNTVFIHKKVGESPLQALERYRNDMAQNDPIHADTWINVPMTYAGRLDPMAEGQLLILIGDECKNKDHYLGLDKEYETEIVFGISTDTYDGLGLAALNEGMRNLTIIQPDLSKYVRKFIQKYPPYSSRTIDGVPMHELARSNSLPGELPSKEVEIYSITAVNTGRKKIESSSLYKRISDSIKLISGDFRQREIVERWCKILDSQSLERRFPIMMIRVKCSSGTYMRSLADEIGRDAGCGAFALSINRTKIFNH